MKKILVAMWMAGLMISVSHAGEVKVTWHEPEKFTDIRPTNETPSRFQERVIKEFNQMFADLAKALPDGYQWNVTVTDVDLAGDVRPSRFSGAMEEIRVLKDPFWPRMAFSYDLKDPQGQTVASGKEDIADMSFLLHAIASTGRTSFPYEQRMLQDWFRMQQKQKTFPP